MPRESQHELDLSSHATIPPRPVGCGRWDRDIGVDFLLHPQRFCLYPFFAMENDKDQSAPVTKADIASLRRDIADFRSSIKDRDKEVDYQFDTVLKHIDHSTAEVNEQTDNTCESLTLQFDALAKQLAATTTKYEERLQVVEQELDIARTAA